MSNAPAQPEKLRYEYKINPASENNTASHVLRFVGQDKHVLEIGTGPGVVTRVLKELNHCTVTGVEIDQAAIERVRPYCERVLSFDLNHASWAQEHFAGQTFDCVVAADVLEHLYDPLQCLKQLSSLCKADGEVVISLPHAGNNAVLAALYSGDFQYRQHGLLDNTHIRFFGIKNIQQLFEDAGLSIVDVGFVARHAVRTELNELWRSLPSQVRQAFESNPYGNVYQVVVKARRQLRSGEQALQLMQVPMPQKNVMVESAVGFMSRTASQCLRTARTILGKS